MIYFSNGRENGSKVDKETQTDSIWNIQNDPIPLPTNNGSSIPVTKSSPLEVRPLSVDNVLANIIGKRDPNLLSVPTFPSFTSEHTFISASQHFSDPLFTSSQKFLPFQSSSQEILPIKSMNQSSTLMKNVNKITSCASLLNNREYSKQSLVISDHFLRKESTESDISLVFFGPHFKTVNDNCIKLSNFNSVLSFHKLSQIHKSTDYVDSLEKIRNSLESSDEIPLLISEQNLSQLFEKRPAFDISPIIQPLSNKIFKPDDTPNVSMIEHGFLNIIEKEDNLSESVDIVICDKPCSLAPSFQSLEGFAFDDSELNQNVDTSENLPSELVSVCVQNSQTEIYDSSQLMIPISETLKSIPNKSAVGPIKSKSFLKKQSCDSKPPRRCLSKTESSKPINNNRSGLNGEYNDRSKNVSRKTRSKNSKHALKREDSFQNIPAILNRNVCNNNKINQPSKRVRWHLTCDAEQPTVLKPNDEQPKILKPIKPIWQI